jgi:hypothetical protein
MWPITLDGITEGIGNAVQHALGEDFRVYPSATVAGKVPCVYITFVPTSGVRVKRVGHVQRHMMVDIVYLEDFDEPNLNLKYTDVVDKFDAEFEMFPVTDTKGYMHILRAIRREWSYSRAGLHYKFALNLDFRLEPTAPYMKTLERLTVDAEDNDKLTVES